MFWALGTMDTEMEERSKFRCMRQVFIVPKPHYCLSFAAVLRIGIFYSILKAADPKAPEQVARAVAEIEAYLKEKSNTESYLSKRDRAFIKEDGIIIINWCYQNEKYLVQGDHADRTNQHYFCLSPYVILFTLIPLFAVKHLASKFIALSLDKGAFII